MMKISSKIVMSFDKAYETGGMIALTDKVNAYNKRATTKVQVPYKHCDPCDCDTPSLENVCLACGTDNK